MTEYQFALKVGLVGLGIVSACSLTVPSDDEVFAPDGASGAPTAGTSGNGSAATGAGASGGAPEVDGGAGGEPSSNGGQAVTGGAGGKPPSGGDAGAVMQGGAGGEPPAQPTGELVNPSFENGLLGWTIDPASAADPSQHSPNKPPVFQQWGGAGAVNVKAVDGDYVLSTWYGTAAYTARIYQVIEGLEDGTYTLKAHIANIATINTAELYAKGCSDSDPAPLSLTGSETLVERVLEGIEVKGGRCEIGINVDAKAADWLNADLVSFEKVDD
jgi:hypothetical protein